MDDRTLFVSDGRRELEIPFSQIEQVRETMLSKPKMIILDLKWVSEFGWKIVFIPHSLPWHEWHSVFGGHPLVSELEQRALKAVMQTNP